MSAFVSSCTRNGASVFLVLLLLLNSACTTLEPSKPIASSIATQIPSQWTANGRISVIRGAENWYARFSWIQQKDDFKIRFTGPMGETQLQVSQIGSDVRLKTPSVEKTGNDLELLILQETGWIFPVSSLHYWLHGKPEPDITAKIKYNDAAQIWEILQQGWKIQYPRWMLVNQLTLPKKIIVTKADLKIKIIISQWLLAKQALTLQE